MGKVFLMLTVSINELLIKGLKETLSLFFNFIFWILIFGTTKITNLKQFNTRRGIFARMTCQICSIQINTHIMPFRVSQSLNICKRVEFISRRVD